MTRTETTVRAALDLARAARFPTLVAVAWLVGYAILGPVFTW